MKQMLIALICASMLLITGTAFADGNFAGSQSEADAFLHYNPVDNSTNNVYDRKFVNPGITPLPQTNGFFTAPTPDSSFRSVKDLIRFALDEGKFSLRMTEGALQKLAKGGDVVSHLQIIRGSDQVPRIYGKDFKESEDNPKWLTIAIEEPVIVENKVVGTKRIEGLRMTGYADGEADDGDTNSFQVIGKIGLKAVRDGNNYLVITAEGAHRKVEATGWGIGFYTTGGTVSNDGQTSGIVGGGTGWSTNETGPEDRPWVQGYVGCKAEKAE